MPYTPPPAPPRLCTHTKLILVITYKTAFLINSGFRSFLLTFATAGVLPMINTYGLVATNALAAVLAWIGFL